VDDNTKQENITRLEAKQQRLINKFDKCTDADKNKRGGYLKEFIKVTEELHLHKKPRLKEKTELWFMKKLYKKGQRMNKW